MKLELQDLKTSMADIVKAAITEIVSLMANKPAPTIVIGQEVLQATNQQALDSKKEIESMKGQLGKQLLHRPSHYQHG